MGKKIAIIGAHSATKLKAPYDDDSWEIWACSNKNESVLPRHDIWFEIHSLDNPHLGQVYLEWLKKQPFVYMQEAFKDYPGSVHYPIQTVVSLFGEYFFTGTVSYMMALAILEKPEEIGLWGFSQCPEYKEQRSSILHFVQLARDAGIKVTAPAGLLDAAPLYGYTYKQEIENAA